MNGVLRTSDGYIIITKRAEWVGEHPGMLDTPGGHPEPSAVDPIYDLKVNSQEVFKNVENMDKKKVITELFKSQQEEMELEFNIERIVVPTTCYTAARDKFMTYAYDVFIGTLNHSVTLGFGLNHIRV